MQFYVNRSADICLVMQAVGQARHSLSMRLLQSLWVKRSYIVVGDLCNRLTEAGVDDVGLRVAQEDVVALAHKVDVDQLGRVGETSGNEANQDEVE